MDKLKEYIQQNLENAPDQMPRAELWNIIRNRLAATERKKYLYYVKLVAAACLIFSVCYGSYVLLIKPKANNRKTETTIRKVMTNPRDKKKIA